jgi:hypothetical protein
VQAKQKEIRLENVDASEISMVECWGEWEHR